MAAWPGKRTIAIVTACMTANGKPDFVLNEVSVTQEEAENAIHYCLVEADLLEAGFEEPFVHFDEDEAPAFLHAALRQHLDLDVPPNAIHPTSPAHLEEAQCPA
jgi:hypothetical protein